MRDAIETGLEESQTAQEETDQAARDVLQLGLIKTKNQLWKDLSWLTRKHYQEEHPYLAGYSLEDYGHSHSHEHNGHHLDDHHHDLANFPSHGSLHAQIGQRNDYSALVDNFMSKYIKDWKLKPKKPA